MACRPRRRYGHVILTEIRLTKKCTDIFSMHSLAQDRGYLANYCINIDGPPFEHSLNFWNGRPAPVQLPMVFQVWTINSYM